MVSPSRICKKHILVSVCSMDKGSNRDKDEGKLVDKNENASKLLDNMGNNGGEVVRDY